MKTIRKIDVGSAMLYGAVLYGLWALVSGVVLWLMGWIFGAQAWYIDMNLVNWTEYTLTTFLGVLVGALFSAVAGALGGLVVALIYNIVANVMGGVKVEMVD